VRDATLTLLALMGANILRKPAVGETGASCRAGSPEQLQIMYGVGWENGGLWEWEVPWLQGYEKSRPVRIGNAAHGQLQLDVFGEVMDALYQARRGGIPESEPAWALERALLAHLASIWREPDEGIWEVRGGRRQFTHSKMMAWVAFDRGIKSAHEFGLQGPVADWHRIRAEIHDDVCRNGFDTERGCFVQAYGSKELDASLLLTPAIGFLPPTGPSRTANRRGDRAGTCRRRLCAAVPYRQRRRRLPPGEGAFLACSFWLADACILLGAGRMQKSCSSVCSICANDVGSVIRGIRSPPKRLIGNFPQAFSHISLVNTAHNLTHVEQPVEAARWR